MSDHLEADERVKRDKREMAKLSAKRALAVRVKRNKREKACGQGLSEKITAK